MISTRANGTREFASPELASISPITKVGAIARVITCGALILAAACMTSDSERVAKEPVQGARSVEAPNACDSVAAHPADVARLAAGVDDAAIIPAVAVAACRSAISEFGSTPRFEFQLGRALLAQRDTAQATEHLTLAAEKQFAPAIHYVAELKMASFWRNGEQADADTALELFQDAAQAFPESALRLKGFVLSPENYVNSAIMEALNTGDIATLNESRILVAHYFQGFNSYIGQRFNPSGIACPALLYRPDIQYGLDRAAAGDPANALDRILYDVGISIFSKLAILIDPVWKGDADRFRDYLRELGAKDAQVLAESGCESVVAKRVYGSVIEFSRTPRPLAEYLEPLMNGGYRKLFTPTAGQAPAANTQPK